MKGPMYMPAAVKLRLLHPGGQVRCCTMDAGFSRRDTLDSQRKEERKLWHMHM